MRECIRGHVNSKTTTIHGNLSHAHSWLSSFARFYHLESYFFEKKAELDCMQITVLLPMLLQTFSTIALSKLERTHTGTTHTVAPNVTSNIGLLWRGMKEPTLVINHSVAPNVTSNFELLWRSMKESTLHRGLGVWSTSLGLKFFFCT